MAYNYRDTVDSDLIYPNLVSANIKTSNPTTTMANKNLSPEPPQSSSVLQSAYSIISQSTLLPYKFEVEREVLERANKREQNNKKKKKKSSEVDESIEFTLSEVERTGIKWDLLISLLYIYLIYNCPSVNESLGLWVVGGLYSISKKYVTEITIDKEGSRKSPDYDQHFFKSSKFSTFLSIRRDSLFWVGNNCRFHFGRGGRLLLWARVIRCLLSCWPLLLLLFLELVWLFQLISLCFGRKQHTHCMMAFKFKWQISIVTGHFSIQSPYPSHYLVSLTNKANNK